MVSVDEPKPLALNWGSLRLSVASTMLPPSACTAYCRPCTDTTTWLRLGYQRTSSGAASPMNPVSCLPVLPSYSATGPLPGPPGRPKATICPLGRTNGVAKPEPERRRIQDNALARQVVIDFAYDHATIRALTAYDDALSIRVPVSVVITDEIRLSLRVIGISHSFDNCQRVSSFVRQPSPHQYRIAAGCRRPLYASCLPIPRRSYSLHQLA